MTRLNVKMVKSISVDITTVRYRGAEACAILHVDVAIYILKYKTYIAILWTYRARTSPEKQFTRVLQ